MSGNHLKNLLQKIVHTQEEEISCSECFELVSRFVELELSDSEPEVKLPQVKQHLLQCSACREEYETLRDLQRLDDEGPTPSVDDLQALIR